MNSIHTYIQKQQEAELYSCCTEYTEIYMNAHISFAQHFLLCYTKCPGGGWGLHRVSYTCIHTHHLPSISSCVILSAPGVVGGFIGSAKVNRKNGTSMTLRPTKSRVSCQIGMPTSSCCCCMYVYVCICMYVEVVLA
jgi:hypothetical protein